MYIRYLNTVYQIAPAVAPAIAPAVAPAVAPAMAPAILPMVASPAPAAPVVVIVKPCDKSVMKTVAFGPAAATVPASVNPALKFQPTDLFPLYPSGGAASEASKMTVMK